MAAVSIIMPVRNAEAHLGEAIASVQAQTFADWELLIVDDGSTDASPALAAASAAADPRIRMLAPASGRAGAAAARNEGLRQATGTFVAFLDADDLYEPEKLEYELATLARYPTAAMTYGPAFWSYEWAPEQSWTESMRPFAGRLHPAPELLRRVIIDRRAQVPCTCAVLIRRTAMDETDGFFEDFRLYEDQTLWVQLMLRHPVFVHDRVLCVYRQHSQSVSAQAQASGEYDRMTPHAAQTDFLEWVDRYVQGFAADKRLQRSLRLAFAKYPGHRRPLTAADRLALAWRATTARAAYIRGRIWRRTRRALRR